MLPFLTSIAPSLQGIAELAITAFVIPFLIRLLGSHLDSKAAATVEQALKSAIKAAISTATTGKSTTDTLKAVLADATTRNAVSSLAVDFMHKAVPDALKRLGVTGNLGAMVEARIDEVVGYLAEHYIAVNTSISAAAGASTDVSKAEGSGATNSMDGTPIAA